MLTAIIVVYATPAELAAALASLHAQTQPPDEIIIVDNGAADGLAVSVPRDLDGVRVVRPNRNIGFGAGCNAGAAVAKGSRLLLMNGDVVLSAEAVGSLRRRLDSHGTIAVVGPRIMSGGQIQLSARRFPGLRTGVLGRRSLMTRLLVRLHRYPADLAHARGRGGPVDWVSGACMLVRRTAFEEVGGFDPMFWMYWEDADLCRRLRDRGWGVHFEPSAVVHHATGASGTSARTIRAFHESAALFATRHLATSQLEKLLVRALLRARGEIVLRMSGRGSRAR